MRRERVDDANENSASYQYYFIGNKIEMIKKHQNDVLSKLEMRGLEPLTYCMPCNRSSQMSYTPESITKITEKREICQERTIDKNPF